MKNRSIGALTLTVALSAWLVCLLLVEELHAQKPQQGIPNLRSLDSQASDQPQTFEPTVEPKLQLVRAIDENAQADSAKSVDQSPPTLDRRESSETETRSPFVARLWSISQQDLRDQSSELAMQGESVELAFPLRIMSDGIWLGMGSVQSLQLATSAVLPDSRLPVPDQLWDVELGAMRLRNLENGWRAGGMFRVGSPSDQPFTALRDMTVTLLGFLTIPAGHRDAWDLSLFYSPTGQVVFPIPGVAYAWRPSSQFEAKLGVPFSLKYRPTDTMLVSASYRPLNDVQLTVRQSMGNAWSIYADYRTFNDTFLLADRLEDRQRTYLFDQRLALGCERRIGLGWNADLSAAYVFDRKLFQAEKFSGSRSDELHIEPGVAAVIQFVWTR